MTLTIDAVADDETIREWGERVEQRCPVSDNIEHGTDVDLSVEPG